MSKGKGAATAAPAATLDELAAGIRADLDAIEGDNRSALEHAIAAGEKLNRAKAQVAHGEWLPWLRANFPSDRSTAADYMRLADPANVGRALHLSSIREALAAMPKETKPKRPRARSRIETEIWWEDDAIIAWAARRLSVGVTIQHGLVEESKGGAHGWPGGERHLNVNAARVIDGIVRDRKRRGDTNRRRKPKESGKRLRELHAQTREGRAKTELWNLQVAVAKAVAVLEWFDLPDIDWTEHNEMLVAEIYDDLARHAQWTETAIDVTVAHMDELGRSRKIKILEARANDPSSTPNERASAARLAERLRGKADAARLGA